MEITEGGSTLSVNQGSCDRLFYSVSSSGMENVATEKIVWKGSSGITVKEGILYAKKPTKAGKSAKVTLKCGKSKIELPVIVK